MIRFEQVTVTLPRQRRAGAVATSTCTSPRASCASSSGAPAPASRRCSRAVNGLVPHFTGGAAVRPGDRRRPRHPRRTRRATSPTSSGYVGQDPLAGFVTDTVEEELAYGMESLGVRARRDAPPGRGDARPARPRRPAATGRCATLSGGPAAAGGDRLGARPPHPRVLVLDEPTSALDPTAAEEVLAALHAAGARPRHHRADGRAPARAGRAVRRPGGARARRRPPAGGRRRRPTCWRPPRSRRRSSSSAGWPAGRRCRCRCATPAAGPATLRRAAGAATRRRSSPARRRPATLVAEARGAGRAVRRPAARCAASTCELRGRRGRRADGPQRRGQVDPARRRWSACAGPDAGSVRGGRRGPRPTLPPRDLVRRVGLVPQEPGDLLYADTVARRVRAGRPGRRRRRPGTALAVLAGLVARRRPATAPARPVRGPAARARARRRARRPRRRSCCSTSRPAASTTPAKAAAGRRCCASSRADGHAVVLATHDVELVAEVADRAVVLADGEVVGDGPTARGRRRPRPRSRRRWPRCSRRCRG